MKHQHTLNAFINVSKMADTMCTEKFNIESLPTEVLVEIFGYLKSGSYMEIGTLY